MRALLITFAAVAVMVLAYWAYLENYRTQTALSDVHSLERQIAAEKVKLGVLQAEWAYLNRPERLRDLADINFETLGLGPLSGQQFGLIEEVRYHIADTSTLSEPVDTAASLLPPLQGPGLPTMETAQ